MSNTSPRNQPDLETYQQAVWDFLLEHCDLTERGSFFVKFHTSGRFDFEKRIRARYKYGYHRVDERNGFDIRQKERDADLRRKAHLDAKAVKQRRRMLSLEEQRKAHEAMRLEKEKQERLERMPKLLRVIHSLAMQPLAQKWYNKVTIWVKNRHNLKSQ